MTHEPECGNALPCICKELRAAALRGYRQGRADGKDTVHDCAQHSAACCSASYRRGFNDHARAAATSYQMFGIPTNQHGEGTNP